MYTPLELLLSFSLYFAETQFGYSDLFSKRLYRNGLAKSMRRCFKPMKKKSDLDHDYLQKFTDDNVIEEIVFKCEMYKNKTDLKYISRIVERN